LVRVGEYELNEELYYWHGGEKGEGQTWVRMEADGRVTIGITDLAGKLAGKLRFIRIKPPGATVTQGQSAATLETGKWVGPVEAPISGTIVEVNRSLRRNPQALNKDPYGEGWVAKLTPTKPDELQSLVHGEGLIAWYTAEIEKKLKKVKK
jgi:glycine cleavage system H protein